MSTFIENSKHAQMTAAVTDHFFGNDNGTNSGEASGKNFNRGGDLPYNGMTPPFGHPNTGVNYTPPKWAGTTSKMTDDYT